MFTDAGFLELPPPSPLYRQFFTADEIRLLDATPLDSPVSEIAILRVLITRVLASIAHKRKPSLESLLGILIAFCQTVATIASLARIEFKRRGLLPSEFDLDGALDESEL